MSLIPIRNTLTEPTTPTINLDGRPAEIGELWGRINQPAIVYDLETFFLTPARAAGLSESDLVRQSARFVKIVEAVAPHWLEETAAVATAAGVGQRLYTAFLAGIYRNLFLQPECTSYAVMPAYTRDNTIFFHKNRDNVDKAQAAFVINSNVKGVNKFIATSDASAIACMMMVNDKGLAGSADYPGGLQPDGAPPMYRGITNPFLLRYIAENATDCTDALNIIHDFVGRRYYAGGDVNGTHWLFVDRKGLILEVSNNACHITSEMHTEKAYFSRLRDSTAANRLRETERPVDFMLFHGVSRDPSICLNSSISGMTVEIDAIHPELFTCAWIALPAHAMSFPLLMGQRETPLCLINGAAYGIGRTLGDRQKLWEAIESAVHSGKNILKDTFMVDELPATSQRVVNIIAQWTNKQSAMILKVLEALQRTLPEDSQIAEPTDPRYGVPAARNQ